MDATYPRLAKVALRLMAVAAVVLVGGCSSSGTHQNFTDASPAVNDLSEVEPFQDSGVPFDALGRVCTLSSQCDDGVSCTQDFCASDNRCVNLPNSNLCSDGMYCDGIETCNPTRGCVRGTPVACNSNDACLIDACDEATQSCTHTPRDLDHDGDPDWHCHAESCGDAGVAPPDTGVPTTCWVGGDCNDLDPNVNSRVPELCGNGIDDNCDGFIDCCDEAVPGGCLQPPNQTCASPLDVSAGGHFVAQTAGTTGTLTFPCAGGPLMHEIVSVLHLATTQDVVVSAATADTTVFLIAQNACGSTAASANLACTVGFPATYRAHSLAPGDYFFVYGIGGAPEPIQIDVTLAPPTPVPTNDSCATPGTIPATGGSVMGDLIGVASPVTTSCGGAMGGVVYSLTLPSAANVTARLTGGESELMQLALLSACSLTATSLQCNSGAPATFVAYSLPAGTYFIAVQGDNTPAYNLMVTVDPPSVAPVGDTCAAPLPLVLNTSSSGTLMGRSASFPLSCAGGGGSNGVAYSFTLTSVSDVTVLVSGGLSDYFYLAIDGTCGVQSTETGCEFGSPGMLTARGLDPGTYYLIIKGLTASDFTLSTTASAPVAPVAVTGNDVCSSAWPIPSGGGLFTGDTSLMHHDYTPPCVPAADAQDVVFLYHSDTTQNVTFSLEGSSFDTVMWIDQNTGCPGTDVPGGCNDDAIGTASAFTVNLAPGDYNLFITGFAMGDDGPYTLTVTPMP